MIDKSQIKSQVIQYFDARERPLSFDEILEFVSPHINPNLPSSDQWYSSGRVYEPGQRFFHPARDVQAWFTVVEIEDAQTIVAEFDNGDVKRFLQGSNHPKVYADDPKVILEEILQEMPEIKKVGSFYFPLAMLNQFPVDKVSNLDALDGYLTLLHGNTQIDRDAQARFREVCNAINLTSLYYVVLAENLVSVLKHGVLARNLAPTNRASFANESIQEKRHTIIPNGRLLFTLHDYAPLFFSSHPPLLYHFLEKRSEVVKVLVEPSVLLRPGALFFNMNAVSVGKNKCFDDFENLKDLNWKMIRGDEWKIGTEEQKQQNGLYRQAEVAIPLRVHPRYFQKIEIAESQNIEKICKMISDAGIDLHVEFQPDFF